MSFLGLLIGILMFAYGNLFSCVSIFRNVLGLLDMDVNMQTQWLFIVVPFFMMGWRMNRSDSINWVYKHAEMLLILSILGYLIEVIIITFTNVKTSTTLCLFTYPIVYFLILVAFKYPHIGDKTISHYCAGISSFMYLGHIAIVITMQNIGLSETPTFVIAVLLTVILGAIVVKLNHRILNGLI